jgi:hypothetical protein
MRTSIEFRYPSTSRLRTWQPMQLFQSILTETALNGKRWNLPTLGAHGTITVPAIPMNGIRRSARIPPSK